MCPRRSRSAVWKRSCRPGPILSCGRLAFRFVAGIGTSRRNSAIYTPGDGTAFTRPTGARLRRRERRSSPRGGTGLGARFPADSVRTSGGSLARTNDHRNCAVRGRPGRISAGSSPCPRTTGGAGCACLRGHWQLRSDVVRPRSARPALVERTRHASLPLACLRVGLGAALDRRVLLLAGPDVAPGHRWHARRAWVRSPCRIELAALLQRDRCRSRHCGSRGQHCLADRNGRRGGPRASKIAAAEKAFLLKRQRAYSARARPR
jgi:hypothetical protein